MFQLIFISIFLIGFSSYWYLYLWKDVSQFFAFSGIGFTIFVICLFWHLLSKFEQRLEYFEDNLLNRFPELKHGSSEINHPKPEYIHDMISQEK